jgi:hypothetical protein
MFEHGSDGFRVRDGIMIECDRSDLIEITFRAATQTHIHPRLVKALPQCGFVPFPKHRTAGEGVATL